MIFTCGSGSSTVWDNAGRVKSVLIFTFTILLTASLPLFSSPDYNALVRSLAAMPSANSLKTIDSLSRTQGVSGAQALRLSGDRAFIKDDYKKAAAFYKEASQKDNSSVYRHLYALAAALDGQTTAAKETWNAIAEDLSDELSTLAALHLAYLEMQEKNFYGAYAILQSAAPADTASPLYIPFIWEMLECSREMKSGERISFHEKQLAVFKEHILESNETVILSSVFDSSKNNTANASIGKPQAAAVKNIDKEADKKVENNVNANKEESRPQNQIKANFTIQVGAFGSKDNAENLVKKLSGNYKDVTILPPAIGGPVLYRVRVGSFVKKEDAEAEAQKLSASGMSPRVVEK